MRDYHVNILHSEEDGGYIADIPDLESCSAFGETAAAVLAEVEERAWLEAALSPRLRRPTVAQNNRPPFRCAA